MWCRYGSVEEASHGIESVEEALVAYFVVMEVSRKRCTVLKVSKSCVMSEVSRKRGRVQDFLFQSGVLRKTQMKCRMCRASVSCIFCGYESVVCVF